MARTDDARHGGTSRDRIRAEVRAIEARASTLCRRTACAIRAAELALRRVAASRRYRNRYTGLEN